MIKIKLIGGLTCPILLCDSCGKEIKKAGDAAVVFSNSMKEGDVWIPAFVHKDYVNRGCMSHAEKVIEKMGESSGWVELTQHIAYLASNVKCSIEEIQREYKWRDAE